MSSGEASSSGKAQAVKIFISLEHACGYYPDRVAQNLVLDPIAEGQKGLYDAAITRGFRRGGGHIYRPHCAQCSACVASRIDLLKFKPSRAQRRCLKRNADLRVESRPAVLTEEYFALYQRYLAGRHVGGGMDEPSAEDFSRFLLAKWSQTEFIEFRLDERLLGVAVTDVTRTGLSAVYCFYDPNEAKRSLGVFAILCQIQAARAANLTHLYLGFWLDGHAKMHYKASYSGLELLRAGEWRALEPQAFEPQALQPQALRIASI